jgi:hypothetical protein
VFWKKKALKVYLTCIFFNSIQQAEMGAAMDALEKCKPVSFSAITAPFPS